MIYDKLQDCAVTNGVSYFSAILCRLALAKLPVRVGYLCIVTSSSTKTSTRSLHMMISLELA